MPGDEEESTTVLEAEPEATAGPETDSKLEELVTEGEVGTQAEQEAEKPEQEPEQETEPSFDEQLEAAKGRLAELKESDSEQYEKLTKLFGGDDVAAQRTALEQDKAGLLAAAESQAAFATVQSAYEPDRQAVQASMAKAGNAMAQVLNKAAQEAGTPPTANGARLAAALQQDVARAENTGRSTGYAEAFLAARTAVLLSPLGVNLNTEELTQLSALTWQDAVTKPQETYGALVAIVLQAAVRAAPEAAVKQGVAKSEATVKATELLGGLLASVPKNGKVRVSTAASSQPRNETEARNWHADGKWTTRQMRTYLAKLKA